MIEEYAILSILCIEESHLKKCSISRLRNFHYPPVRRDRVERDGGGVTIFISLEIPYINIQYSGGLEAAIVKNFLSDKSTTLCNIYLPPADLDNNTLGSELNDIYNTLEKPFIIMADANAYHIAWGSNFCDRRGKILDWMIGLQIMVWQF